MGSVIYIPRRNTCRDTLTSGLLHYYKMNDTGATIVDSISGLNLTNSGGTAEVIGKLNTAYQFESADYASSGDGSSVAADERTLSFWLKITAYPTTGAMLIFSDNTAPSGFLKFGFAVVLTTAGIIQSGYTFGGGYSVVGSTALSLNTWYNITSKQMNNSGSLKTEMYIDSVYNSTHSASGYFSTYDRWVRHYLNMKKTSTNSNVIIDDVKIWNRELSDCEIEANCNSGNGIEI